MVVCLTTSSHRRQTCSLVAAAIADDRKRFLGQRGEHQFTLLAVAQHGAGLGIDDFRKEMILSDAGFALQPAPVKALDS
jgi:hypothetical protein